MVYCEMISANPTSTKPCKSCANPLGKRQAKGLCVKCYAKKYKADNRHRMLELQREYYQRNKTAFLLKIKTARKSRRTKMIADLGGKCACCGETETIFLCLDHIKGGGRRDYQNKGGVHGVWRRAIKEGLPKDKYRVLCWNCNAALGLYGHCPHGKLTSPVYHPKRDAISK
jgi:hypothetical protein